MREDVDTSRQISTDFQNSFTTGKQRRNLRRTTGTGTPLFGLMGPVPITFQDKKVKNLLSPAVNRSDLRKLNYNKTILPDTPSFPPSLHWSPQGNIQHILLGA